MSQLIYLVPLGITLLSSFVYLRRLERSEALSYWVLGFGALFGGAVFILPDTPAGWAMTSLCSTAFVALMYAGARRFAALPLPAWLWPAAAAIGGLRAATTLAGHPGPMSAVAAVFAVVLLTAAGRSLLAHARASDAELAERLLGPGIALLGWLMGASIGLRFVDVYGGVVFGLWIYVAVTVGFLQLLAGFERTRRRDRAHEQALEQERRTLRAVLDTAPLDIVLRDAHGRVRTANRSAAERFGIRLDAAGEPTPGQTLPAALAEELTGRHGSGERLGDHPEAVIERAELASPADQDVTLEVFSSPVESDGGEDLGRLWIARDVTQEKRLQHELLQSQKMETLGTLAGGVAHDFNNQLTTILGNARIARDELGEDHTVARECLADLERAAAHCAALTQGLLAFARRTPTTPAPIALGPLLTELEALLRATLPTRIRLELGLPDEVQQPVADPTQLKQVILNLAINGRDAIPETGEVRISARDVTLAATRTTLSGEAAPGRYVEITVEDSGIGIEPACLRYIFDPFFTTKPTGEGTGLGLAIAYGVVSAHGGYIDVDSRPGRTRVHVGIPAAADHPTAAVEHRSEPTRGAGERILLADDEPAVRRLLRGRLTDLGYRVHEADCGELAVEIASEPDCKIDLAMLDLSMPGMDGLETLEMLRRDRPDLPGLIISGYFDARVEQRVREVAHMLGKPFDDDALARAVRQALAQ